MSDSGGSVLLANKKDNLKGFRSAIARLKREGLVHPDIDARRVVPERALRDAVKRFQSVIKGNAKSIPFSRLNLTQRDAIARNLQVARPIGLEPRVIVPHFKGETVKAKSGSIEYSSPEGIRRLELPRVRTDTVGHFFGDLKRSKTKLPQPNKNEYFAARFFNGRTQLFSNVRDLLNTLNTYDSVVMAHGRKQTAEVIRNIEILRIPRSDKQTWFDLKKQDRIKPRAKKSKGKKRK